MRRVEGRVGLEALLLLAILPGVLVAQEPSPSTDRKENVPAVQTLTAEVNLPSRRANAEGSTKDFLVNFAGDQKDLWTSPRKLRFSDTVWLVPFSGLMAGLFVTDKDVSGHLSDDPKKISRYNKLSSADLAALAATAGGMWLMSYRNHNEHWRETGFLAGEAALHSLVMTEALKYSLRRQRPDEGNGDGGFFQPGGRSFPSEQSAAAWSIASVIAHEYPGPLTKILAYGGAALVGYSRVHAQKHFPSDTVMGALLGQLVAHEIYKKHHNVELGGDTGSNPVGFFFDDGHSRPGFVGSPKVPLDSWIYPALDRLAAMGLIESDFAAMRPWTRLACARMVTEAQDHAEESDDIANDLVKELRAEFQPELGGGADQGHTTARLESVYFRTEYISGTPLTDGYYFAQTKINDFGRPYSEGWNTITGFSAYATSGPWAGYIRGEVQTAPEIPALPLAARQFVGGFDGLQSVAPAVPTPAVQQFQLQDAYVGLTMLDWEVSFGRQSLSWGPGDGGALMLSDNAAPINMFRINRVAPWKIPLVSQFLGPVRVELFLGQLTGQHFVVGPNGVTGDFTQTLDPQPFIHGERFTFKPTRNFEFGFSRTTLFGGPGVPLTFHTFAHTFFTFGGNGLPGTPQDPGDRRSGMDWSYRLPRLRNWATFYGDAFAEDQPSPIAYWDRSAIRAGLYFSHLPKLPKLDLRMEGVYTDLPAGGLLGRGFFYTNARFKSGYTNDGVLMGSWIGRDGQGAQAWSNYWFNTKDRLRFSFRHQKVSQQFSPGGGSVTDAEVGGDYWLGKNIGISASLQYERWLFPVINANRQQNLTASFQIQFQPQKVLRLPNGSNK